MPNKLWLAGYKQEASGLRLACQSDSGQRTFLKIDVCTPQLFRIRGSLREHPLKSILIKQKVIKNNWVTPKFYLNKSSDRIFIKTAQLAIKILKRPLRISFYDKQGRLLLKEKGGIKFARNGKVSDTFCLAEGEHFFGFGEKTGHLDKRGERLCMWNSDPVGYGPTIDPLYKSVPFFLSTKGYGIFFANTYKTTFDLGKTQSDVYSFQAEGGLLDYYFIYGPSFKEIIRQYTELTGRAPLPPKWAFGLSVSKWGYTQHNIEEIYQGFRDKGIPCDLIILDLEWVNKFWDFQWNLKNYPEPGKLISELADKNFKLGVIVNPVIQIGADNYREGVRKSYFVKSPAGRAYNISWPWGGKVGLVDFTNPGAATWWGNQHKQLVNLGVNALWLDMNEPSRYGLDMVHLAGGHRGIHNIYGLLNAKTTSEWIRGYRPDKRIWLLSRSAFAGSQRYVSTWSGDCPTSFLDLRCQVQMGQNMGLSGIPYWGHDIGGFMSDSPGELYIRWLQFGMFTPLARIHSSIHTHSRVPWEFGEEIEEIARKYIKLRYRLLPYIYSYARQANQTGLPIMRAMVLEYQDDPNTYYWCDGQYMFGKEILVAPICEAGLSAGVKRTIYFPRGEWIDYWTGQCYEGPGVEVYQAGVGRLPLFIKAGAIIPMGPDLNWVEEKPASPLTLEIYPSGFSDFTLYEDDGETYAYERGEFSLTRFTCNQTGKFINFNTGKSKGKYKGKLLTRAWQLNVHAAMPSVVKLDKRPLRQYDSKEELEKVEKGWWYDSSKKVVVVKPGDNLLTSRAYSVTLEFNS